MGLESGKYLTRVERRVVVWPPADANGNGERLEVIQRDEQGREVGRMFAKDANGKEVRQYRAPEGFVNRPSFDNTANWVLVDGYGDIVRQPNGEAVCIKPGQAIVFNADGSTETLPDEYSQYMFSKAHDSADDVKTENTDIEETETDTNEEDEILRRADEIRAARGQ